jgi:hypothetical protein
MPAVNKILVICIIVMLIALVNILFGTVVAQSTLDWFAKDFDKTESLILGIVMMVLSVSLFIYLLVTKIKMQNATHRGDKGKMSQFKKVFFLGDPKKTSQAKEDTTKSGGNTEKSK